LGRLQQFAAEMETGRAVAETDAQARAEAARSATRRDREREQARDAAIEASAKEARRVERKERAAAEARERAIRETAEETARVLTAPVEVARAGADVSVRTMARVAQRTVSQIAEVAETSAQNTQSAVALAQSGALLLEATQAASVQWMKFVRARAERRVAGFSALTECRSPKDLLAWQGRMLTEQANAVVDAGARLQSMVSGSIPQPTR
jgi:hypothetical protein